MNTQNNQSMEEWVFDDVKNQLRGKQLNTDDIEYLEKFSLFNEQVFSLLSYSAAMMYLNPSLRYLVNLNEENTLKNPFFKILMTLEDTNYKIFIVSFANLFNLNSTKNDTFTIRTLLREIGIKRNGKVEFKKNSTVLFNQNDRNKALLERTLNFFDNKEHKKDIKSMVDLRNHIIAHPTTKDFDYNELPKKLNEYTEFLLFCIENLYIIMDLDQQIDFRTHYKEERYRWAFYFNTIKKYGSKITSNSFIDPMLDAYEISKKMTKDF